MAIYKVTMITPGAGCPSDLTRVRYVGSTSDVAALRRAHFHVIRKSAKLSDCFDFEVVHYSTKKADIIDLLNREAGSE